MASHTQPILSEPNDGDFEDLQTRFSDFNRLPKQQESRPYRLCDYPIITGVMMVEVFVGGGKGRTHAWER